MTMEFRVKITLGNDAIQTPLDIAEALKGIADELTYCYTATEPIVHDDGDEVAHVYDTNGNRVGLWSIGVEF